MNANTPRSLFAALCALWLALPLAGCPDEGIGADGGAKGDAGAGASEDGGAHGDGGAHDDGGVAPSDDGGAAPNDGGAEPNDGGAEPNDDGGVTDPDGGVVPNDGGGVPAGDWTPPEGPYVLVSPPAASQASEADAVVVGSGPFDVEVRVGQVSSLRTLGFVLEWDPAKLTHVSRERVDGWLTSNGGSIVPLNDQVDAAAGTFHFAAGIAGQGAEVSTTSSEAVYRLTFDYAAGATEASIAVELDEDGLVQDGASAPLSGVLEAPLSVRPE